MTTKPKAKKPRKHTFTELLPPCQNCGHRWGAVMIQQPSEGDTELKVGMACAHCGKFCDRTEGENA